MQVLIEDQLIQTLLRWIVLVRMKLYSGSGRKKRYRDAYDAASKFKAQTDYKAKQEAQAKENARAQRATMKIADDISVMEGFKNVPCLRIKVRKPN